MDSFVPFNLGFNHVTRQETIDLQVTTIARELMGNGEEVTAVIFVDRTYIYIQVRIYLYALLSIILYSF